VSSSGNVDGKGIGICISVGSKGGRGGGDETGAGADGAGSDCGFKCCSDGREDLYLRGRRRVLLERRGSGAIAALAEI